ncbi:MAG: RNA polymerase sigma factor [Pseudomonadota bacterium]
MSRFLAIALTDECLRRAAQGDRPAQREIYEQSAGPAFALIRRLIRNRAAAEDVFQDCMVALLQQLPQFRGEAPFGAWARQVALRHCLMHLRSPWQRARHALGVVLPGDDDARRSLIDQPVHDPALADRIDLDRALARLPELTRVVVWLYDVEGLSHEEIAAQFGRSVSFSKSQVSRAHAQLRAQLIDHRVADALPSAAAVAAPRALP